MKLAFRREVYFLHENELPMEAGDYDPSREAL